jgi:hypothetical protein
MLPKIQPTYYDFEINGKIVEFRAWKTKDEKEFLILQTTKDEISDEDLYNSLVKPCLKNPDIKLTEGEKQMLMIEIRKKSFGDSIDVQFTCGNCKKYNETKMKLSDIVKYTPYRFEKITKNGISISFRNEIDVSKLPKNSVAEYNFSKFVMHVETITIDNEVHRDFSFDEAFSFFDELEAETFDYFFNEYSKQLEDVSYHSVEKCMFCKTEQDIGLGDIPNLFPW